MLLAIDGMQPDVGHEVLWIIRDCLSGEALLARTWLSSTRGDLATLLNEVKEAVPVPIRGVISDGQQTIRRAVERCLPDVPHQLCHFHYLDEAADPIFQADRHAKTELKKLVRGVRPIERSLEGGEDCETDAMRSYCLAVRSALTDDGHPRCVPPASNCMTASPRSPTHLRGSRQKGGPSAGLERTPPPPGTRFEEDRGGVASARTSLCFGPSGSKRAGQS